MKQMTKAGVKIIFFVSMSVGMLACMRNETTPKSNNFTLRDIQLDKKPFSYSYNNSSVTPEIILSFSEPVDHASAQQKIILSSNAGSIISLKYSFSHHDSTITVSPVVPMNYFTGYYLNILATLASSTEKTLDTDASIYIFTQIS